MHIVTLKCTGSVLPEASTLPAMSLQELAAPLAHSGALTSTPGPDTTRSSVLAVDGGLRRAMHFVAVGVGAAAPWMRRA